MDSLKQKLLDLIAKKSGASLEEIEKGLKIKSEEELKLLKFCIESLQKDGLIHKSKNDFYVALSTPSGIASGKIKIGHNTVSVITNDGYNVLVPKKDTEGLLNGDLVLVSGIFENNQGNLQGTIKSILKRKNDQITCEVINENGKNKLITYNGKARSYIKIDQKELDKHGIGEILLIKLNSEKNNLYDGKYVKYIGHVSEPDMDEKTIIYDHGFETEFSKQALKELEKIPTYVNAEKHIKEGRKDLREKVMFTIDGADTKDIDDSIGLEILPNGNYKLYVNIADVGYYIKDDSALFKEAYERGTSIYANDTVTPMLPFKISNGVCSLHPHVDRLTKTCEMIIDQFGNVVDYQIYDSIINSRKKMTYEDVNKILIDGEMVDGYEEFNDQLKEMNKLSKTLENNKIKRGYINFNRKDFKAYGKGSSLRFEEKTQRDAEKIIENFMLLANETVAQHIFYRGLPFIYRVHEAPNEQNVKDFLETLNSIGFKFKNCKSITSNKFIQNITEKLKESEENSEVLSELLLINTMKRAKYSNINIKHFGLALSCYTHFTSPIRRFADLQVHKLLDLYKNFYETDYSELSNYLSAVAKHCSERSNEADKVEREASEMRMAQYLETKIGTEYEAVVTYVTQSSLKIKTQEGFTGMIETKDLKEDNFKYVPRNNSFVGINTGIVYRIGSPITVKVKNASAKNRIIKFSTGEVLSKDDVHSKNNKIKRLYKK